MDSKQFIEYLTRGVEFIKTHPDAILPCKSSPDRDDCRTGDSGYDIFAVEDTLIPARGNKVVPVGLSVAYILPCLWFRIESRSGLSFKHNILAHPGIIDNGYRGDLGTLLYNHSDKDYQVKKGDKIAQIVIYPLFTLPMTFVEQVTNSDRGEKGIGSSGK